MDSDEKAGRAIFKELARKGYLEDLGDDWDLLPPGVQNEFLDAGSFALESIGLTPLDTLGILAKAEMVIVTCLCGKEMKSVDMYDVGSSDTKHNRACSACYCDECDGDGECVTCEGAKKCHGICAGADCDDCKGTGRCSDCDGKGYTNSGISKKEVIDGTT